MFMVIPFDTMKTIQAAAVLLKEHGGQMSRLRLLKLLYIADRQALAETRRPITGDRVAAMDHGPVPSTTYNLLKGEHSATVTWDQFIKQVGPQEHRLIDDPGVGRLSRYEIEKLRSVSEQRREKNDYDIALETHEFEEWQRNQPPAGSSRWIPLDDILAALHLEESKQRIVEAMEDDAAFDAALASVRGKKAAMPGPA
jgi:uncharacterized phage-associated protein